MFWVRYRAPYEVMGLRRKNSDDTSAVLLVLLILLVLLVACVVLGLWFGWTKRLVVD